MVIKPTPGRVVWYFADDSEEDRRVARPDPGQPLAAVVARVWDDRLVNLTVFDADGATHGRTSVPLVQEGDPRPRGGGYATWMPFQVGQAKAQTAGGAA